MQAGWDEWRIDDALQEALCELLEAGKLERVTNTYLYLRVHSRLISAVRRDARYVNLDNWIKRKQRGE